MACFSPLTGFQRADGTVAFVEERDCRRLELPCGQCIGCRLERSRQAAVRCVHEAQCHDMSSFVTLTYDGEAPSAFSLFYPDFQKFMKRLRRSRPELRYRLRFYMCGEYGEQFGRAHFHALLFGVFFSDRQYLRKLSSGFSLYRSAELERLWPHGFSSIGDVSFESAAYVARYATKSAVTGGLVKRRRVSDGYVDLETGEFDPRVPEFNRMSLKPGLAAPWFKVYGSEVFGSDSVPRDSVVLGGQEGKPPRYYDKLLEKADAFRAEYVKELRLTRAMERSEDNTDARLRVREVVQLARLRFKKRSI